MAVRRIVTKLDGTPVSAHVRHWVTSIDPDESSPRQMLKYCRGYWSVENKNHWKRDAVWDEDKSRVRTPAIARSLALLRSALLAPLARSGYPSLPVALETLARDSALAIRLIQHQRLA